MKVSHEITTFLGKKPGQTLADDIIIDDEYELDGFVNVNGDFYKLDEMEYLKIINPSKINLESELRFIVKFRSEDSPIQISKKKFKRIEKLLHTRKIKIIFWSSVPALIGAIVGAMLTFFTSS